MPAHGKLSAMAEPTVKEVMREIAATDPDFEAGVSRFDVRVGEDSNGLPGIFIKVVLADKTIREYWPHRNAFKEALRRRLWKRFPDSFPFVWFSAESEAINPEVPASA